MGCLKPCLSTSGANVEYAVLELYDESSARSMAPGFDDVTGQPFLVDSDGDGIGERVRPGTTVRLRCKSRNLRPHEQVHDGVGNAPEMSMSITLYAEDLIEAGLYDEDTGELGIRENDKLLRLEREDGTVRFSFETNAPGGMHCYGVSIGETGEDTFAFMFERRRPVSR